MNNELIIYTTEEGGILQARWGTREQYEKAVRTGVLKVSDWENDGPVYVDLAFIVLASADENYDFIAGRTRSVVTL